MKDVFLSFQVEVIVTDPKTSETDTTHSFYAGHLDLTGEDLTRPIPLAARYHLERRFGMVA